MPARTIAALTALLLAAPSLAAGPVSVLLDRSSVAPDEGPPAGRDRRVLAVQTLPPRVGVQTHELPLAWSAAGQTVSLDPLVTGEIRAATADLDPAARVAARLQQRALEAGEQLGSLDAAGLARLLTVEQRGTGGAGQHRIATVRVLTRGNVRDRWSVRSSISSPAEDAPAVQLAAPRLLQVDVVSLGLHVESDDASLPPRFAHVGLRARLWRLSEGRREWDRALLIGTSVPDDGETGGGFRARAESLLDDAADRLAAELWPELALELDAAAPEPPAAEALPAAAPPLAAATATAPGGETGDELLERFAASRLEAPPAGDPWQVLAEALRPELDGGLATALACADDPLGAAVETGSERLGLGLAETYRRVEISSAFRKALAEDLLQQVRSSAGDDWPLERAARYLLAELLEQPAPAGDAPAVAGPLLQRARLDQARTPEGLASLLIGLRIWPEGGRRLLQELSGP